MAHKKELLSEIETIIATRRAQARVIPPETSIHTANPITEKPFASRRIMKPLLSPEVREEFVELASILNSRTVPKNFKLGVLGITTERVRTSWRYVGFLRLIPSSDYRDVECVRVVDKIDVWNIASYIDEYEIHSYGGEYATGQFQTVGAVGYGMDGTGEVIAWCGSSDPILATNEIEHKNNTEYTDAYGYGLHQKWIERLDPISHQTVVDLGATLLDRW